MQFLLMILQLGAAQGGAPAEVTGVVGPEMSYVTEVVKCSLPFTVIYQFDRSLNAGVVKKVRVGKPGEVVLTIKRFTLDGKLFASQIVFRKVVEPVHTLFLMGRAAASMRGSFTRGRVLIMEATAYSAQEFVGKMRNPYATATGMRAVHGVAAVDPRVIKLGTKLYIEGYGYAVAGDTGGAIKGNRIDLCFNTLGEMNRFGRRKVKVHILN